MEGLIHASEMPLEPGQPVKDILTEGQAVQVRVLHVDASHDTLDNQIGYSFKARIDRWWYSSGLTLPSLNASA